MANEKDKDFPEDFPDDFPGFPGFDEAGPDAPAAKTPEWLGAPPDFSRFDEELEADVIVCGAGVAGVAAARAACEAGASVLLFEKAAAPQGRSGQFAVLGGKLMARWGLNGLENADRILAQLVHESHYKVDQRLLRHVLHHIGEDFDWYLEGLPEEGVFIADSCTDVPPEGTKTHVMLMQHPAQPRYHPEEELTPCYHVTVQIRPTHVGVLRNNLALAEKTGNLTCRFKTPAKKLLRNMETGRICGVVAQDYDGKVVCARARRGVVLATGDYSGDREMLEALCPTAADYRALPSGIAPDRKPINTGDGHRMAMWAGARLEDGPHAPMAHNMGAGIGVTPFLELDRNGERFMNEDCSGQQLENRLSMTPGKLAWQIFDSAWPEQIEYMPFGHSAASRVLDEEAVARGECFDDLTPMDGFASQSFLDRTIRRGAAFRADTLEELIAQTGMPADTALASIARYNELARRHCDEDFGKSAARMFPIEKGPFYACRITPTILLCCLGGLENDDKCRVLDTERNVMPGLYAAGNVQGNRCAIDYPTILPGWSHTMALSLGREAGRNAAAGL